MRIGVDVGGTHTDAVLFDEKNLIAACKTLTTEDISSGVLNAVREVLKQASVPVTTIQMMMLGTTQFTNAVVERRHLSSVGAIRIGAQSSAALPVGAKWPDDIAKAVIQTPHMINGGHDYDGSEIISLDRTGLRDAIQHFNAAGITNLAVTSVFSTANPGVEQEAASLIQEIIPTANISLSHKLGRIGLYQRENATLLNASLLPLAKKTLTAFQDAFAALQLTCPFFISQNDGTLMSADYAARYPVLTFSSGPTNSMRGAAWLSGKQDAMVVDVGGTTADIGMLINSFPRPSGSAVRIGGVLTNFRMPDVLAIALGGGSIISDNGKNIGPESVGRELPQKGLAFGGDILTATDIAVAAGDIEIGNKAHIGALSDAIITATKTTINAMLTDNIDKMKTSAAPLPLVVVGGGGFLVPDRLDGVSEVIHPTKGGVANAIGAAFAQISGEADHIYSPVTDSREEALAHAKALATENAIKAGALADTIAIAEIDEMPMTYMENPGVVLHAKAIGDADLARFVRKES